MAVAERHRRGRHACEGFGFAGKRRGKKKLGVGGAEVAVNLKFEMEGEQSRGNQPGKARMHAMQKPQQRERETAAHHHCLLTTN